MQHLAAFAESIDPAGALVNLAAVNDDSLFTSGDDVRVPNELPFLLGEAALLDGTAEDQAQIQSPSLRQVANIDLEPIGEGLVWGDPAEYQYHPHAPLPLRGDEAINFLVNSNPAAAALHYGLVWFGDGPQQAVNGNVYSVRATATLTAVATAWVNATLTFAQDLPVGMYDVVGMRCRVAGGVAARLNFIGGAWRPGVPAVANMDDVVGSEFRFGRSGVFGSFHTNTPPSLEVIAAAGAVTPVVILDLIPRG